MGEIAEGLIDGTFDSVTGEYLGEGPGYPRTRERTKRGSKPINYESIAYGILMPKGKPDNMPIDKADAIIVEYTQDILKLPQNIKKKTACKHIKINKTYFIKWFKEKYPQFSKHL